MHHLTSNGLKLGTKITIQLGGVNQSADAKQAGVPESADAVVAAGQGAPVAVPPSIAAADAATSALSARSSRIVRDLTPEELTAIAQPNGGVGLKGIGELTGKMARRNGKYVLITAAEGSRSEVSFATRLQARTAKKLVGQTVTLHGLFEKKSQWSGTVQGAKVVKGPGVALHSYQLLSGKIDNQQHFAIGGEGPPSGSYLVLDKPVRIGRDTVKQLYVANRELTQDDKVTLSGRVEVHAVGGPESGIGSHIYGLSGVTNVTAGEPSFDGKVFKNKNQNVLQVLSYDRPLITDAPAVIFILDPGPKKAFIGRMGGFMHPDRNPFTGLIAQAPIARPTTDDLARVTFDADGKPRSAVDGELLERIGSTSSEPGTSDPMTQDWYFDQAAMRAYRIDNGGIAPLVNSMGAVIAVPSAGG